MRAVTLLSGGIESLVTVASLRAKHPAALVHGLFVNYGQRAAEQELRAVHAATREYGVSLEVSTIELPFLTYHGMVDADYVFVAPEAAREFDLPSVKEHEPSHERAHVVPMRNLIFMAMACSLANTVRATELWLGFDWCGENEWNTQTADKSPEFVKRMGQVLNLISEGPAVELVTPLQGNTKVDTLRTGAALGVDWRTTWSCYNAFANPCGVCAQCLTRKRAFAALGEREPVTYCTPDFLRSSLMP